MHPLKNFIAALCLGGGMAGCASLGISQESASLVAYEAGVSVGKAISVVTASEASSASSDSLSGLIAEAIEASFRAGLSDGLSAE